MTITFLPYAVRKVAIWLALQGAEGDHYSTKFSMVWGASLRRVECFLYASGLECHTA